MQKGEIQKVLDMAIEARDQATERKTQLQRERKKLQVEIQQADINTRPQDLASWLSLSVAYDMLLSKADTVIAAAEKQMRTYSTRLANCEAQQSA